MHTAVLVVLLVIIVPTGALTVISLAVAGRDSYRRRQGANPQGANPQDPLLSVLEPAAIAALGPRSRPSSLAIRQSSDQR